MCAKEDSFSLSASACAPVRSLALRAGVDARQVTHRDGGLEIVGQHCPQNADSLRVLPTLGCVVHRRICVGSVCRQRSGRPVARLAFPCVTLHDGRFGRRKPGLAGPGPGWRSRQQGEARETGLAQGFAGPVPWSACRRAPGSAGQGSVHSVTPNLPKGAPAARVRPSGAGSGRLPLPPGRGSDAAAEDGDAGDRSWARYVPLEDVIPCDLSWLRGIRLCGTHPGGSCVSRWRRAHVRRERIPACTSGRSRCRRWPLSSSGHRLHGRGAGGAGGLARLSIVTVPS
jgi:hypothetical protein